jgi:curli biogenesis system outer membrane secretion channel CsgG
MNAQEARKQTDVRKSMRIQSQYSHCKKEITKAVFDCKSDVEISIHLCEDVLRSLELEGYGVERIKYTSNFIISW